MLDSCWLVNRLHFQTSNSKALWDFYWPFPVGSSCRHKQKHVHTFGVWPLFHPQLNLTTIHFICRQTGRLSSQICRFVLERQLSYGPLFEFVLCVFEGWFKVYYINLQGFSNIPIWSKEWWLFDISKCYCNKLHIYYSLIDVYFSSFIYIFLPNLTDRNCLCL